MMNVVSIESILDTRSHQSVRCFFFKFVEINSVTVSKLSPNICMFYIYSYVVRLRWLIEIEKTVR